MPLTVNPAAGHDRGVTVGWLRVGAPVGGADVVVVDDTWVSGGSAQSAAAALKLAGARRVAVIVLGRHVNDGDPASARFLATGRCAVAGRGASRRFAGAINLVTGPCPHGLTVLVRRVGQWPRRARETAMQYALLVYTKPGSPEGLSPAEREALSAEYYALRDEPGMVGGAALQPVTTATTLRQSEGGGAADHRRAVRRHQGGVRRLLPVRGGQPGPGDRDGRADPDAAVRWRDRGPTAHGSVTDHSRTGLPRQWGRVLAVVVGYLGDFELAEESVAEAFEAAARRWPAEGMRPARPRGW